MKGAVTMNQTLRLTRFLASLVLLAAFSQGASHARAAMTATTPTTQDDQIARGTRQCLREAQRDFNRCRRRARGRRGALARCRRNNEQRRSACSG
jgi:hypothetical protein